LRLTIDDYSKQFKMSKEMIKSRLRAKKIDYEIEDGITYIVVMDNERKKDGLEKIENKQVVSQTTPLKPRTTVATVLSLYQKENQQLKEKIIQLEQKIDKLIDDKEQMLRFERDKIEELYNHKDEQLKTILELINQKLILEQPTQMIHEIEEENVTKLSKPNELIELKTYLKGLDIKSNVKKVIKKRFLSVCNNDVRIIQQNGKLYLDFSKYDYSDLFSY